MYMRLQYVHTCTCTDPTYNIQDKAGHQTIPQSSGLEPTMLTSSVQDVIANTPRICTLVLFIKLHTHIMQVLTIYVLVQELASSDVNSIQGIQGLHVHDICFESFLGGYHSGKLLSGTISDCSKLCCYIVANYMLNTPINNFAPFHYEQAPATQTVSKCFLDDNHTHQGQTPNIRFFSHMHTNTNKYIVKPEIQLPQKRVENTVHVHRHQVVIILLILGRKWVQSPIISYRMKRSHTTYKYMYMQEVTGTSDSYIITLTCKSIHECSKRTVQHFEERISDRILVGAT